MVRGLINKLKEWNMQTIAMVMIPVMIGVVGQIFLKKGMLTVGQFDFSSTKMLVPQFIKAFSNLSVLTGFFLYFVSSLFWMIVLSRIELSVAYPLLSTGYIMILLASYYIFNEPVSALRWLGVLVICMGVVLISKS